MVTPTGSEYRKGMDRVPSETSHWHRLGRYVVSVPDSGCKRVSPGNGGRRGPAHTEPRFRGERDRGPYGRRGRRGGQLEHEWTAGGGHQAHKPYSRRRDLRGRPGRKDRTCDHTPEH